MTSHHGGAPCATSSGYRPLTIPEAAQLVIRADRMSKGGDVFVLNMGYAPTQWQHWLHVRLTCNGLVVLSCGARLYRRPYR